MKSLTAPIILAGCLSLFCSGSATHAPLEDLVAGDGKIGMLAYHRVIPFPGCGHPQDVSQAKFKRDLDYLSSEGYTFLTTRDLAEGAFDPDGRNVLITVDDGRQDNFTAARPILDARGIRASFFVPTVAIGWEEIMDWDQLRQLAAEGHRVESHTVNHADLSEAGLTDEEILAELALSKEALEEGLEDPGGGPYEVTALAYPYGGYDRRAIDILEDYGGYRYAITIDPGVNDPEELEEKRFELRRFEVYEDFPIESFF